MVSFKEFLKESSVDMNKVWKDFARISTNRPSKSDIPTLRYKESKKWVEINWGDYAHLGGTRFGDNYFMQYNMNRDQFMDWLDSQGLTGKRLKK